MGNSEDDDNTGDFKLNSGKGFYQFWTTRSVLEKRLIITAIIFTIILCIFLVYLLVFRTPEICTSTTCLETSMKILNQIDDTQEPCRDFHKFSCGNFMRNTNNHNNDNFERARTVPDIMREEIQSRIKNILEQPLRTDQPRSLNLAKEFFRSCTNESATEIESIKWIKQIFRRTSNGWPILLTDNEWNEKEFEWMKSVHKLKQMGINFEFFITLSVVKDKKDPTKYILQLSDPYKNSARFVSNDIRRSYLRYMEDVAVYFGSNRANARIEQQDVLEFILKLAEISEIGRKNNMSNLYNPYILSELQYEFHVVDWLDYINGMLEPATKLTYDDQILVPDPFYLRELEHLMLNTSKRVLANFMAWQTLQKLANFMPTELIEKAHEYMENVNGKILQNKRKKWEICLDSVRERMGPIISSAYIEQYFDDDIRRDVTEMTHNIKMEYRKFIEKLNWFDGPTRKITLEKLLHISSNIISYKDMSNLIETTNEYNEVKIYHDNVLLSVLNLDQFLLRKEFGKLRRRHNDDDDFRENWLKDPDFVTGFEIGLSPSDDILVFPMALLDGVYYGKHRQKFSNYGSLGTVISTKIWQLLTDTQYRIFKGNAKNWWSSSTLFNYDERLRCLGRSFVENQENFNESKMSEEDLAHLIGIKVAFNAYQRNYRNEPLLPGVDYNQNQLFLISFASQFCTKVSTNYANFSPPPKNVRLLNGILRNYREFSENFSCKSDNFMSYKENCNVF